MHLDWLLHLRRYSVVYSICKKKKRSPCFSRFRPGLKHRSTLERMKAEAATAKKLIFTAFVSVAFGRMLFPLMVRTPATHYILTYFEGWRNISQHYFNILKDIRHTSFNRPKTP